MTTNSLDLQKFMDKVKQAEAGHTLDLSSDEDLSIAIMNLISIEEHLFFTGNKTGKTKYFDLLNETREMRKELLKMIIKDYEGEVWCISKHLLAASMRLMEVGTKLQKEGKKDEAKEFFADSYKMFTLFFALRLKIISIPEVQKMADEEKPMTLKDVMTKLVDCCNE